jgi:hypothetical protein
MSSIKKEVEVNRYSLSDRTKKGLYEKLMVKSIYGSFVAYEDYSRLKAENNRLREAGDALVNTYVSRFSTDEPAVRAWRAAKV